MDVDRGLVDHDKDQLNCGPDPMDIDQEQLESIEHRTDHQSIQNEQRHTHQDQLTNSELLPSSLRSMTGLLSSSISSLSWVSSSLPRPPPAANRDHARVEVVLQETDLNEVIDSKSSTDDESTTEQSAVVDDSNHADDPEASDEGSRGKLSLASSISNLSLTENRRSTRQRKKPQRRYSPDENLVSNRIKKTNTTRRRAF
jgi:hypothetical protein